MGGQKKRRKKMFSSIICVVALAMVLPAIQADYCDYISTKDCFHIPDITNVCGTNGVTYRNACTLSKAFCKDGTTHKAHDGSCTAPPTTPVPVLGSEIALNIFCLDLNYVNCPTTGVKLCATDGNFYPNMCEFDKARCYHRDMHANGTVCT